MDILTCEFVYSSRRLKRELNICMHTEFFLVQRTITPLINMQGLDKMSNVEVHLCAPCSCPKFCDYETMKLQTMNFSHIGVCDWQLYLFQGRCLCEDFYSLFSRKRGLQGEY